MTQMLRNTDCYTSLEICVGKAICVIRVPFISLENTCPTYFLNIPTSQQTSIKNRKNHASTYKSS